MSRVNRAGGWCVSDSECEEGADGEASSSSVRVELSAVESGRGQESQDNPNSSSGSQRRRRTRRAGQSEAERLQREQAKEERERRREERQREKEENRREQQWRKETAQKIKSLKPENCLKCLTVHIHPALLQDSGCDVVLEVLGGLELQTCIEEHDLLHSISWTRQLPHSDGEEGGVVEEDQVVMVVSLSEFVDMVTSIRQTLIGESEEAESLFQPLSEYLNRNTDTVVSLLVMGAQHTPGRESWGDDGDNDYNDDDDGISPRSQLGLKDTDIEEVLVYLQLHKSVSVQFLCSWRAVADHVCAVTKALSKRPFKELCEVPQLDFCVDGSWAGGVRVDRGGRGLAQVWTRQIQQLNRVSVAMATAVTDAHPSPQILLEAYRLAQSEEERRRLLADLIVRGGANERHIGPELSSRVYRLLTSQNPQLVLD